MMSDHMSDLKFSHFLPFMTPITSPSSVNDEFLFQVFVSCPHECSSFSNEDSKDVPD